MKNKLHRILFVLLIVALFVGGATYVLNPFHYVKSSIGFEESIQSEVVFPPERIRIPKLNKDLSIKVAEIRDEEWQVYDDAVAWLSTSAVPGEGNAILYGHNRSELLAGLGSLEAGDEIEILQGDEWVIFRVFGSRSVQPDDVQSVLSDNNQLTIYSCEGAFDQKRRVVYAEPVVSLSL